jgi:hypothetical protein
MSLVEDDDVRTENGKQRIHFRGKFGVFTRPGLKVAVQGKKKTALKSKAAKCNGVSPANV